MVGYLTDGDSILAVGAFENMHHFAAQNAVAQEATEGELWWLTEEGKEQAEQEWQETVDYFLAKTGRV